MFKKLIKWLISLHIHHWEHKPAVYVSELSKTLSVEKERASRTGKICSKRQELDIHCLGLNPPRYNKTWRTVTHG